MQNSTSAAAKVMHYVCYLVKLQTVLYVSFCCVNRVFMYNSRRRRILYGDSIMVEFLNTRYKEEKTNAAHQHQ